MDARSELNPPGADEEVEGAVAEEGAGAEVSVVAPEVDLAAPEGEGVGSVGVETATVEAVTDLVEADTEAEVIMAADAKVVMDQEVEDLEEGVAKAAAEGATGQGRPWLRATIKDVNCKYAYISSTTLLAVPCTTSQLATTI